MTILAVLFRKKEVIGLAALLVVALVLVLATRGPVGGYATISVVGPHSRTQQLPLQKSGIITVEDGALPVQLEVKDGAIRFINSVCKDHTCEGFGWLSREGEWALCAPAGVKIVIR